MEFSHAYNKSVFTQDSYKYSIGDEENNGTAVIKIIPEYDRSGSDTVGNNDLAIVGIIQNPLAFDIEADWGEMGGVTGMLPMLQAAAPIFDFINSTANKAGFSTLGDVYASRKIYKKSGYLNLSANIKIVNWNNDGAPINASLVISRLLLPDSRFGIKMAEEVTTNFVGAYKTHLEPAVDAVVDKTKEVGSALYEKYKDIPLVEGVVTGGRIIKNVYDGVMEDSKATRASYYRNTMKGISDYFILRASPVTVRVEVGNYFKQRDMIITNAKFEFSKEVTETGPLYVDVSLTMSSRTHLTDETTGGIGFGQGTTSNGRVVYQDENGEKVTKNAFNMN